MAGRPPLRIGQHGKMKRTNLGGGVWEAYCLIRDTDGVIRKMQRRGPADENDYRGKLAEDALVEALAQRRPPSGTADEITLDTRVSMLIDRHIERLAVDGRAARTLDAYRADAEKLSKFLGGVRVGEATPGRLDDALRAIRAAHGVTTARRARTVLSGGLHLAVLAGALGTNPVRDVSSIRTDKKAKGARALTADELRALLSKIRVSDFCESRDLVDPIVVFMATGMRVSELLALRWEDYDADAGTLAVSGKVARANGQGLCRFAEPKSEAGLRTNPLPRFAIEVLDARRSRPFMGQQQTIFASTAGSLRDPNNFAKQWRAARDELGVPEVTTHSFRKTMATLIDDEGMSARVGADQLGHSNVSMTQDRYMTRGRVHGEVAALLDRIVTE
jgi:integrase